MEKESITLMEKMPRGESGECNTTTPARHSLDRGGKWAVGSLSSLDHSPASQSITQV